MKKVLITGMSGLIGGILRRHLEGIGGYEICALNRSPVEGVEWIQADIGDLEALENAFVGRDIVVHLAAHLGDDSWEGHLAGNIIGTYNVFEAARRTGVKRVVFASSGATVVGFARDEPYKAIREGRYEDVPDEFTKITHTMTRPQGIYGAAKVWGEAIGRHFSDAHGLSVICVRIGQVWPENRPLSVVDYDRYTSHRDVATMFRSCIEAPEEVRYDIFHCTSNNKWAFRDLDHPKEVLGWVPQDSADTFR